MQLPIMRNVVLYTEFRKPDFYCCEECFGGREPNERGVTEKDNLRAKLKKSSGARVASQIELNDPYKIAE